MKRIISKSLLYGVMGIITALLLFSPASALASYLDFNIDAVNPPTAKIWYAGGDNPLYGVNISVDTVLGFDTPLNSGVGSDIILGRLSFITGNLVDYGTNYWKFGSGRNITLTGGVDLNGDGHIDFSSEPYGILLTGTFDLAYVYALPSTDYKIDLASFQDTKNDRLIQFYGLPNVSYNGDLILIFSVSGSPPDPFTSTNIITGTIVNTPVPVPTTFLLLATGLLGLIGFYRKFKK